MIEAWYDAVEAFLLEFKLDLRIRSMFGVV